MLKQKKCAKIFNYCIVTAKAAGHWADASGIVRNPKEIGIKDADGQLSTPAADETASEDPYDKVLIPYGVTEKNRDTYEVINYVNDVNREHTEALMEYGKNGDPVRIYEYGNQRLSYRSNAGTQYYAYSGLGSVSNLTDEKGNETVAYSYDAYGNVEASQKTENPYTYNAEYTDYGTGLQYLRARYYDPESGTFISEDDYLGELLEPLSQNRYTYAEDNPVNYDDPSGHGLWDRIKKTAKKAVKTAKKTVKKVASAVKKTISGLVRGVGKAASKAWNGLKDIVSKANRWTSKKTNKLGEWINKKLGTPGNKNSSKQEYELRRDAANNSRKYMKACSKKLAQTLKKFCTSNDKVKSTKGFLANMDFVRKKELGKGATGNSLLDLIKRYGGLIVGGVAGGITGLAIAAGASLSGPVSALIIAGSVLSGGSVGGQATGSKKDMKIHKTAGNVGIAISAAALTLGAIELQMASAGSAGNSAAPSKGAGGAKLVKSADDVTFNNSSVDKAFGKHGQDFGKYPDGSSSSVKLFEQDVKNLINTGVQKSGTWYGKQGTHIYNPSTKQWAFINSDGTFNTAFKLSSEQYKYLLETGVVR